MNDALVGPERSIRNAALPSVSFHSPIASAQGGERTTGVESSYSAEPRDYTLRRKPPSD